MDGIARTLLQQEVEVSQSGLGDTIAHSSARWRTGGSTSLLGKDGDSPDAERGFDRRGCSRLTVILGFYKKVVRY